MRGVAVNAARLLIGILNEGQFSPRFGHQTGFRCAGRPDPNFDNVPFRLYFLSPWFLPIHFSTKFYAVSNLKKSLDENRLAYSGNILSCLDAKSSETRPHGTGLSQKTHPCGIKCNSPLRSSWPEMMVSNGGVNGKFRSVHSTFSAADFSTMKTSGQLSHTRDGLRALFDSR